jgi:Fe-S oxidoreductase
LKNEYPELGGNYEVVHHTQYIRQLIEQGKIHVRGSGATVTYHDSCYLGRHNGIYDIPRALLDDLLTEVKEMPRNRERGLCCGAGGAQMFKEDEPGIRRINTERVDEVIGTGASAVVANCPFCITMLEDGLKERDAQEEVQVYDLSELILNNMVV